MNEKVQNDIDALISSENDHSKRAVLIVLQSINRSLIANTIATQKTQGDLETHRADFAVHLDNFSKHAMNEEMIINRGKGAWAVLAVVLSFAQAFALYGWNASRNEIQLMQTEARQSELVHQKMQSRIEQLEKLK